MTQNLGSTSNPLSMTGEQWVLEERTDDPLSPEPGECWIRTDLNAGDKIATLKFGDGSEVPIFPTATSETGVLEVRRVQTGGQTGYLPVAEPYESRFPQFRLQHNNTVYSLHDDIEPGTIPDSGLVHHYDASGLSSGSISTWSDLVGNADLGAVGSPSVDENQFNGNSAILLDGLDDAFGPTPSDSVTQPHAVYSVHKLSETGRSSAEYIIHTGDSSKNYNIVSADHPDSPDRGMWAGDWLSGGLPDTDLNIFGNMYDGSNSVMRENGTETVSGNAGTNDMPEFAVGADLNGNQNWFGGHLCEIAIYDPMPDSEQQSEIEEYLADKWGVTL